MDQPVNLTTQIGGGLVLRNPVMTASGTFGYGREFSDFVDLQNLGAIVVKGISLLPRSGNPPPRIVETAGGMLNAIGLENVGVEGFLRDKLPFLREVGTPVVVNILGDSLDDYASLAEILNDIEGISAIEVNISCPNVKKGGVAFGTDPEMVRAVTQAVKAKTTRPVIIKLSPNVTDITATARAAEAGGADAVSLINTLLGMAIDHRSRRPRLANVVGGLSGPAIKPVAFLVAGAAAVQIGTANLVNPDTTARVVAGITSYLQESGCSSLQEIIGTLRLN